MALPISPTAEPMLARLSRRLPVGDGLVYEPKWDGFRCLVFRDGGEVDLRSRHQRPLARYFPELVESLRAIPGERFVVDGEIVVVRSGRLDFTALLGRLHPAASRVAALRTETPASFVAFDVLAIGDEDLRPTAFARRRSQLERLLAVPPPGVRLTPATTDVEEAEAWVRHLGAGVDGVVVKATAQTYDCGRRALVKVKRERTAECAVGGFRVFYGEPAAASLLLGVHDAAGALRHVGVASSFARDLQYELFSYLRGAVVPLDGHPWQHGFGIGAHFANRLPGAPSRWTSDMALDWIPVGPDLVCEVAYDHWDGDRFRYPTRWRRWRPDRTSRSCTLEQFDEAGAISFDALHDLRDELEALPGQGAEIEYAAGR